AVPPGSLGVGADFLPERCEERRILTYCQGHAEHDAADAPPPERPLPTPRGLAHRTAGGPHHARPPRATLPHRARPHARRARRGRRDGPEPAVDDRERAARAPAVA